MQLSNLKRKYFDNFRKCWENCQVLDVLLYMYLVSREDSGLWFLSKLSLPFTALTSVPELTERGESRHLPMS